ncbi:hypothetical protein Dsin_023422 [Dipteronia sinensis]|uniref:KIB1-4 beta-propeller domain-containing protein n=1 Tax=Dipteronia sinensis TaxID=43782 RepID=A0AAE0E226_9ROSI|nr:hypothetical protein Dsin_023422 [Dipteronia sinensis]
MMANWADLELGLLTEIARKIELHEDFVAFRRVCISWRSVAVIENFTNKSNQIPWLMLPHKINSNLWDLFSISKGTHRQFMLPQAQAQPQRLKCFSSNGWLLTINPCLSMALLHPFSGRRIKLPHMNTFKDWNGTLRVSNRQFYFITKFLLSCSSSALDSDYTVIVIHGNMGKLAYFRPGDKVWNTIETWSACYLDVILYQEKIYAIDADGNIMVCDVKGENPTVAHQVAKLPWEPYYEEPTSFSEAYLIESDGALRALTRDYDDDGTCYFMVFEVDWSTKTWKEINDLGNKALFLGYNSSLSVEVSDTSYCKPNCIYFTQDYCEARWKNRTFGKDMGAYNFEDGSITPFYGGGRNIQRLTPPMWIEQSYNF